MRKITDLYIKSFELIKKINPNCGDGTGYSKYKVLKINYCNNMSSEAIINDWYTPKDSQLQQLKNHTEQLMKKYYRVIINQDTIDKFFNILK